MSGPVLRLQLEVPRSYSGWDGRLVVGHGLVLATGPRGLFAYDRWSGALRFSLDVEGRSSREVSSGLPAFTADGDILVPFYFQDESLEIHRLRPDGRRVHVWTLTPHPDLEDSQTVVLKDDDYDLFGSDISNKLFLGPIATHGSDFVQTWVYRQRRMHAWSPRWYAPEWVCAHGEGVVLTHRSARRFDSGEILWTHDAHPVGVQGGRCLLLDRAARMTEREARVQAALEDQLTLDDYNEEAEIAWYRKHPLTSPVRLLTVMRDSGEMLGEVAVNGEVVAVDVGSDATAVVVAREDGTGLEMVIDGAGRLLLTSNVAGPPSRLLPVDAEMWPAIAGFMGDGVVWVESGAVVCRSFEGAVRWALDLPDTGSSFSPRIADRWLAWPRFTVDENELWLRRGQTAWCWRIG